MTRIQYQVFTKPPPSTSPETTTVDRYHQPFTPPTRRGGLIAAAVVASGLTWCPFAPVATETVTLDKWNRPLSEPVRRLNPGLYAQLASGASLPLQSMPGSGNVLFSGADNVVPHSRTILYPTLADAVQFATAAETITVDKWFAPASQPWLSRSLRTAAQPYLSFVKADPFPESVTADRWHQPFPGPTLRTRQVQPDALIWSSLTPAPAEVITVDKWFSEWRAPHNKRGLATDKQPYLAFVKADPFPESVTADRWFQPFPGPTLRKPTIYPQALSWSGFTPFITETITLDKWFAPASQPTLPINPRIYALLSGASFSLRSITGSGDVLFSGTNTTVPYQRTIFYPTLADAIGAGAAETVTVDKWFAEWRAPHNKRGIGTDKQPYFSFVKASPFTETASIDRWLRELSQPTRRIVSVAAIPSVFAPTRQPEPALDSWFRPAAQPVRRLVSRATIRAIFAPSFVPAPSMASWHRPLSLPVRRKVSVTTRVGYTLAFPVAPVVVPSFGWYRPMALPTYRKASRANIPTTWVAYKPVALTSFSFGTIIG